MPQQWNTLWLMLPNRSSKGASWQPAPPLILAAWAETPALLKSLRLREHIEWAEKYGALNKVDMFLRSLPESDWLHISQ
jgi:hypothetical protein